MKTLFDHEKASLFYNEETNAIVLIWKGVHSDEIYKLMFTKGLAHLQELNATCWLSDIRKEGIVSPANSKWLQEEILPKAVAQGLKKVAIVMDKDAFKKFYVDNIKKEASKTSLMHYFGAVDDANKWLLAQ